MLFNINSNIENIKASRFPTLEKYKITFKSSGTDNIIDVNFTLNSTQVEKIDNNPLSKFLKIRLFLINSENLQTKFSTLANNNNYLLLHDEIQKNNLIFDDINCLFDGVSNQDLKSQFYKYKTYNKSFIIPELKINFQSLGYYFYYDLNDYVKDYSLDLSYINKSIFWNNLNVISLIKDNTLQNNNNFIDIRKIKSLLNNKIIDKPTLNIDIQESLNRKLKESKKLNPDDSKVFSNCYLTKNQKNHLALAFNLNYKKLLVNNSVYDSILDKSIDTLSDVYLKINKVTNISILRKQKKVYKNKDGKSYKDIRNTEKMMCSSAVGEAETIQPIDDLKISFQEINTNNSFSPDIKTYTFIDKTAFENGGGIYDYGVKITINNNLNSLYKYLSNEHMSEGYVALERFKNLLEDPNNYNPLDDTLSTNFVESLKQDGTQKKLMRELNNALKSFFLVLQVFGLDKSLDADLEQNIVNIFDPQNLSIQNILYFINIYQKIQLQLSNLSNGVYDSNATIEHWFNSPFEADKYNKYGYKFFNFSDDVQKTQFPLIDSNAYIQKINSEVAKYTNETGLVSDSFSNTLYTFITPSTIIYSNNSSLNLDRLIDNQSSISNLEYSDVLAQLTKLSFSDGKIELNSKTTNSFKNKSFLSINRLKIDKISNNIEEIAKELSITTNNTLNKNSNANIFSNKNIPNFNSKINYNLDTSNLLLQIINNLSLEKKSFNFNQLNAPSISNGTFSNNMAKFAFNLLPIHIKSLLLKKTNLFSEDDKYLKDIQLYCKYLLLFNIIHGVQYLNYNVSTGEEEWLPLTKNILESKSNGSILICKLYNYSNTEFLIEGMKNINLPLYDNYFMLKITNANLSLPFITSFVKNKQIISEEYIKEAISKIDSLPFKNKQTAKNSKLEAAVDILNKKIISSDIEISEKFNNNIDRFLKIKK